MKLIFVFSLLTLSFSVSAKDYLVTSFGAKGDGKTLNTKSIQKAIDKASISGGRVVVTEGVFLTGTLFLKSNVELHLESKAILKGSVQLKDYIEHKSPLPLMAFSKHDARFALITCISQENVKITGSGTIDGSGGNPIFKGTNDDYPHWRPFVLRFIACKFVEVSGIKLVNSPMWMQHYAFCDFLTISKIYVHNHVNHNNDGIDIDMCRNVRISDSYIDSDDDGVCLKGSGYRDSEDVLITNCVIRSNCNALKFGTASLAGLKRMTVTNCTMKGGSHVSDIWKRNLALAAIAFESVDGGHIQDITVSNCITDSCYAPFFLRLGSRLRSIDSTKQMEVGTLKNIHFSNIIAKNSRIECSAISGIPGYFVENVSFDNVQVQSFGKGKEEWIYSKLPENEKMYPEITMFGKLPAWAFFIRHARNIRFSNCTFQKLNPDPRQPFYLLDTENITFNVSNFE